MPGFDNDCLFFGGGVDPRGLDPISNPVVNQMSDGKLLIGSSSAPYVIANTLTAGTGISITNSSGGISIGCQTPVSIANGGTNASSMSKTLGLVKFDGTRLITSTKATIDSSDRYTNTSQPSFLATASAVSSVTGDGTLYTIIFNNETYDICSNFDGTSTFTAPVSGTYLFSILIDVTNVASGNTACAVYLTTSNRDFSIDYSNWYVSITSNEKVKSFSFLAYLDSADTAIVKIKFSNGAKGVNITTSTSFSGFLLG